MVLKMLYALQGSREHKNRVRTRKMAKTRFRGLFAKKQNFQGLNLKKQRARM